MFKQLLIILWQYILSLINNPPQVNTQTQTQVQAPKPQPNPEIIKEPIIQPTPTVVQSIENNPKTNTSNISNTSNTSNTFKIVQKLLPPSQYVQDSKFVPNQIYLHHTAGGTADSTFMYWNSNKERVCTHFLLDRDGTIYQCIPLEKCWGYHLYVSSPGNKIDRSFKKLGNQYDKQSIGIEICNYGYIDQLGDKFVNCYGQVIDSSKVIKLDQPYKGKIYWEKYTDKQIESLKNLLSYLLAQFPKIASNKKTNYSDIFSISQEGLRMNPGIFTHTSIRTDKYDCFPQPELIQMLNNLNQY